MVRVTVRLFARVREICGSEVVQIELPAQASTGACFEALAERFPAVSPLRDNLMVAVNESYAGWDDIVDNGDQVAFIPPVSGGNGPGEGDASDPVRLVEVTEEPISAADLVSCVTSSRAGAIATFEGTVRDHHDGKQVAYLEYEAYAPMAATVIRDIAVNAAGRWNLEAVAVRHRYGRLEIGEVSVAIAVSSAHRAEAFDALRHIIDELKERAPIWKRETGPDGVFWIEGPDQVRVSD